MIESQDIEKVLRNEFPEDADIFKEYSILLNTIEGAYHTAYWILRHIANQYLENLYPITLQIEPVFKGFVLHALDAFPGDKAVIKFYNDYIKFFKDIKSKSDSEEVQKECDFLISEAQEYLDRVQG